MIIVCRRHRKKVNFLTNSEYLNVEMLARPPTNEESLYEEFAASKELVLDVYNPTDGEYLSSVCAKNFRLVYSGLLKLKNIFASFSSIHYRG